MVEESRGSMLMNQYMIQKAGKLNNDTNTFTSGFSTAHKASPASNIQQSIWSSQPIEKNRSDNWSIEKEPVLEKEKTNTSNLKICSSKYGPCILGLIIGSLLVGIPLAAVSTVWFDTTSTIMSTTITSTTSETTTTTSLTTTTTTRLPAVAQSSLSSYCGCSSFTLSLSNISYDTSNTTYQWKSSPVGQNIWSNINSISTISSLTIASQIISTDYQCQIIVLNPTPINLTSNIITVSTDINMTYCQARAANCQVGDNINNFILIGELGTQINNSNTGCSANSYDNRTQESVSLYENMNYTGLVSSQYPNSEQLAIWIDFNKNFYFESWERVAYQLLNQTYNTNVMIVIPSSSLGATIGSNRMRAVVAYSSVPTQCGPSSTYGETHDYTVNILASVG